MCRRGLRGLLGLALVVTVGLPGAAEERAVAHFIDVGQANATLLEFPCGTVLIDAGAEDEGHVDQLLGYLLRFFRTERPDLHETIDTVLVTHNHIDHTRALRALAETFTIRNYVDNGQLSGTGTANPRWLRKNATTGGRNIRVRVVDEQEIEALPAKTGLTDDVIDPLDCGAVDPRITVLSGRRDTNPGWSKSDFSNKNNHSIVVRVDFGAASFLFTGDLETPAIKDLLAAYAGTGLLDTDVWEVGHHGSDNGTTEAFLAAITPQIAVISMGPWYDGEHATSHFNTWSYGHPRNDAIRALREFVSLDRDEPVHVRVAVAARKFSTYIIRRAIYGTGWDGSLRIEATDSGQLAVLK